MTCRRHVPPPQEAAWTAVETTLHDRGPMRRVAASDRPCIGCSNLPLRLRAASAVVPMPVRNARRRGYPHAFALDGVKARRFRPRTSPRWAPTSSSWAAGKVKAGWHRARQHGGQCHPPCFLPCPFGPVAERPSLATSASSGLEPPADAGAARRSPPRSCPAPGRGRLRPPAWWRPGPGGADGVLHRRVGACQTGPLAAKTPPP